MDPKTALQIIENLRLQTPAKGQDHDNLRMAVQCLSAQVYELSLLKKKEAAAAGEAPASEPKI